MPKRKKNKGADYEYVGTARKTTSPDNEYALENALNPQTRKMERQVRQGSNQDAEHASEMTPSPEKRDETRAKPKGHC